MALEKNIEDGVINSEKIIGKSEVELMSEIDLNPIKDSQIKSGNEEIKSNNGFPPIALQVNMNMEKMEEMKMEEMKMEEKIEKKPLKGIKKYGGMILTIISSLIFSHAILIVKLLQDYGFNSYGSSFWRYFGVTVPAIPLFIHYQWGYGKIQDKSLFDSVWPLKDVDKLKTVFGLLVRGILGASSVILRYYALQYLSIGDTSVITYASPVLVTVLAHFLLSEKCGVVSIITAFITLGGVIVITRPPMLTGAEEFDDETLIGTGLAIGSLICAALIVIITRLIREVHFALMTFVFGLIGLIQAFTLTQIFNDFSYPVGLYDTLLVIGLGVLSFFGQMTIILALKFEQAGPVSLLRTSDVLFGFLLQFIFLGVIPDIYSSLGAAIVLFGVVVTGYRKWLGLLPKDDPMRKRFNFILK